VGNPGLSCDLARRLLSRVLTPRLQRLKSAAVAEVCLRASWGVGIPLDRRLCSDRKSRDTLVVRAVPGGGGDKGVAVEGPRTGVPSTGPYAAYALGIRR